jgi:hypothetical protein
MAPHAFRDAGLHVHGMRESKVLTRHLGRVPIPRAPVAVRTGVRVMRILMALDAPGGGRKVQRSGLAGLLDASVALEAVDAIDDMGAVLECPVLLFLLEAQHFGAGPGQTGQHD